MYRNIMVALDTGSTSQAALDEAIRIGKSPGSKVRVVFVADAARLSSFPVRYRAEFLRDARRMLDDAQTRMHAADVECETQLLETRNANDSVPRCLLRCAKEMPADLVVMGTHGRAGARRLVLGSVAETFLRRSACPVLLTRAVMNVR